jgi:hypothetical protein
VNIETWSVSKQDTFEEHFYLNAMKYGDGGRKLHIEDFHDLYSSPDARMIKGESIVSDLLLLVFLSNSASKNKSIPVTGRGGL